MFSFVEIINSRKETVKISVDESISILLKAEYIRWYDSLPAGDYNRIDILDLSFPAYLSAIPKYRKLLDLNGWESLSKMLSNATEKLKKIPLGISLVDWSDCQENRISLKSLFECCMGKYKGFPYFGPACCTKMLHKKRPELIPIIDTLQFDSYEFNKKEEIIEKMMDLVFEIQKRVTRNIMVLTEIKNELKIIDQAFPLLSTIRIYDILFWTVSTRELE